jgi:hypothetical protein
MAYMSKVPRISESFQPAVHLLGCFLGGTSRSISFNPTDDGNGGQAAVKSCLCGDIGRDVFPVSRRAGSKCLLGECRLKCRKNWAHGIPQYDISAARVVPTQMWRGL